MTGTRVEMLDFWLPHQLEAEKVNYYILVYPNELYAKVYKLVDGKYDKQGDFSKESYYFDETLCGASIDFEKVLKRFRKKL